MNIESELSILILSCDAYSDLWDDFFYLKDKYWPDCPFQTYLVTEIKRYERDNVYVINCGNKLNWSGRLRHALSIVNTPLIMSILDDYFICKKVDTDIIKENAIFSIEKNVSFLSLEKKSIMKSPTKSYFGKYVVIPPHEKYPVDTAAAIWNRDYFLQKLGTEDYSAWQFEVNCCNEAKSEAGIDGLILCDERKPLNITEIPIVIQGEFYPLGINFFRNLGYIINTNNRSIMSRTDVFKYQFKVKMAGIKHGRKFLKLMATKIFRYKFFTEN